MKLYHGSKRIIEKPIHQGSKIDNDYGPAFYLTRDLESAKEWANRNNSTGYVNEYEFNEKGLHILDLTDKTHYSVLNWIAILLKYRHIPISIKKGFEKRIQFIFDKYYINIEQYDLVIGYRADDAYFRFPMDFISGNITIEQLEYSFNLGELGIQYVVVSEAAIKRLKFLKAKEVEEIYINKYFENVRTATIKFDELDKDIDGTRIQDIMRNNK